jgi:hypothetical protein
LRTAFRSPREDARDQWFSALDALCPLAVSAACQANNGQAARHIGLLGAACPALCGTAGPLEMRS